MIDKLQLGTLINKCKHLQYKFAGVYAADKNPPNLKNGNCIVLMSDKATQVGTHWLLLCNRNNTYTDTLGLPLNNYPHVRDRPSFADLGVTEIIQASLQILNSNFCGLFCIYIAYYAFGANSPLIPFINEQELMRFVKHFLFLSFFLFSKHRAQD